MAFGELGRRRLLQGALASGAAATLAACGATPTPQIIKEVVTQVVEKEVTKVVEGTPQVVVQTMVVESTVVVEKEVTAAVEPAKLTLWHHWGGTREPLLASAFADFAARNPGLTVEPTLIPWENKEQAILTAVAAGEAPDVLMLQAPEMPPYAINDVLVPVDDLIAASGISSDEVYPSDWAETQFEGKTWGLPHTIGEAAQLLFFNTQQFEDVGLDPAAPPASWADLLQAIEALLVREGDQVQRLGLLAWANGGSWLNYLAENEAAWVSDDTREVQMDNPGAVEALQYIVDFTDAQGGAEQVAGFISAGGDSDPFFSGRTAMTFSGVWNYYMLKTGAPELRYGSALAPINKGQYHEANLGPHLWTLPAVGKHIPEAWKLAVYMSRDDGGCGFLAAQLRPSPWKSCNEGSSLSQLADYWPVIEAALTSTRPEPLTPLFNQYSTIWDDMLDRATRHETDAAATITWAATEMATATDEFWQSHS